MKHALYLMLLVVLISACSPAPAMPAPTIQVILSPTPLPSETPTATVTPPPTPTRTPVTFTHDFFVGTTWRLICPGGNPEIFWIEFDELGVYRYGGDDSPTRPQAWWETDPNSWGFANGALEIWWIHDTDSFPLSGFAQSAGNGPASAPGTSTRACGDALRIEQVE
jgi:hypothetical protein